MSEHRDHGAPVGSGGSADRLSRAADPGFVWPVVAAGPQHGPGSLPVGSPGKVGVLDLDFRVDAGGRTVLADRFQKSPLQVMRPLYVDPVLRGVPVVYVMSTGGGIVGGDRLDMDIRLAPGAHALVTTQAANRVHRMDVGYATQTVSLRLGAGAVCEWLPDPLIPYGGSRFQQRLRAEVPEDAVLIAADILSAGRVARGERWDVDAYVSAVEIVRPDQTPLAVDTTRITSGEAGHPLVTGDADAIATLFVVAPGPAEELATVMRDAADVAAGQAEAEGRTASEGREGRPGSAGAVRCGVSTLPNGCGAWLRAVGRDQEGVEAAVRQVWSAVRTHLLGAPAPDLRKS
ncbi:urease accessory protein UreD [Rhodococcus sp. IEGM 1408]|uniref:urease accessory protein UreD n=1 Tax=Rhodococcus sp. IEGM 1408 TaxID=3082220 RepID=UPI002954C84F|nr:urease accessory protein UreD [Rhodococcus sp. IEGM 1408]MDV8001474.1 urease accessory protein UreD [Rhodococcus sp. IEGM 1408]